MSHNFHYFFHRFVFSAFYHKIPQSESLWKANHLSSEQTEEEKVAWKPEGQTNINVIVDVMADFIDRVIAFIFWFFFSASVNAIRIRQPDNLCRLLSNSIAAAGFFHILSINQFELRAVVFPVSKVEGAREVKTRYCSSS